MAQIPVLPSPIGSPHSFGLPPAQQKRRLALSKAKAKAKARLNETPDARAAQEEAVEDFPAASEKVPSDCSSSVTSSSSSSGSEEAAPDDAAPIQQALDTSAAEARGGARVSESDDPAPEEASRQSREEDSGAKSEDFEMQEALRRSLEDQEIEEAKRQSREDAARAADDEPLSHLVLREEDKQRQQRAADAAEVSATARTAIQNAPSTNRSASGSRTLGQQDGSLPGSFLRSKSPTESEPAAQAQASSDTEAKDAPRAVAGEAAQPKPSAESASSPVDTHAGGDQASSPVALAFEPTIASGENAWSCAAPAPELAREETCSFCFTDHPKSDVVSCSGEPQHHMCFTCFARHVKSSCENKDGVFERKVEQSSRAVTSPRTSDSGQLPCPLFENGGCKCARFDLFDVVRNIQRCPDTSVSTSALVDLMKATERVGRAAGRVESEQDLQKWGALGEIAKAEEMVKTAVLFGQQVRCPQCGKGEYSKDNRCIHLTCTRCKAAFCFACGRTQKDCKKLCEQQGLSLRDSDRYRNCAGEDEAVSKFLYERIVFSVQVVKDKIGPALWSKLLEHCPEALRIEYIAGGWTIEPSQLDGRITAPVIGHRREQAHLRKETQRLKEELDLFLANAPTQPGWPIEVAEGIANRLLGEEGQAKITEWGLDGKVSFQRASAGIRICARDRADVQAGENKLREFIKSQTQTKVIKCHRTGRDVLLTSKNQIRKNVEKELQPHIQVRVLGSMSNCEQVEVELRDEHWHGGLDLAEKVLTDKFLKDHIMSADVLRVSNAFLQIAHLPTIVENFNVKVEKVQGGLFITGRPSDQRRVEKACFAFDSQVSESTFDCPWLVFAWQTFAHSSASDNVARDYIKRSLSKFSELRDHDPPTLLVDPTGVLSEINPIWRKAFKWDFAGDRQNHIQFSGFRQYVEEAKEELTKLEKNMFQQTLELTRQEWEILKTTLETLDLVKSDVMWRWLENPEGVRVLAYGLTTERRQELETLLDVRKVLDGRHACPFELPRLSTFQDALQKHCSDAAIECSADSQSDSSSNLQMSLSGSLASLAKIKEPLALISDTAKIRQVEEQADSWRIHWLTAIIDRGALRRLQDMLRAEAKKTLDEVQAALRSLLDSDLLLDDLIPELDMVPCPGGIRLKGWESSIQSFKQFLRRKLVCKPIRIPHLRSLPSRDSLQLLEKDDLLHIFDGTDSDICKVAGMEHEVDEALAKISRLDADHKRITKRVHVANEWLARIIGKERKRQHDLQQKLSVELVFPKRDTYGDVQIKGFRKNVVRAEKQLKSYAEAIESFESVDLKTPDSLNVVTKMLADKGIWQRLEEVAKKRAMQILDPPAPDVFIDSIKPFQLGMHTSSATRDCPDNTTVIPAIEITGPRFLIRSAKEIIDGLRHAEEIVPKFDRSRDVHWCENVQRSTKREHHAMAEFADERIDLFWFPLLVDQPLLDDHFKDLCTTMKIKSRERTASRPPRRGNQALERSLSRRARKRERPNPDRAPRGDVELRNRSHSVQRRQDSRSRSHVVQRRRDSRSGRRPKSRDRSRERSRRRHRR